MSGVYLGAACSRSNDRSSELQLYFVVRSLALSDVTRRAVMFFSCTSVRIPTLRAHSEAITIETEKPITTAGARKVSK